MLTHGAPHSSTAARHSSTVSLSLIVLAYSRIRPQPVQVRLQACNGSSISTSGNRGAPLNFFLSRYVAIELVSESGKRMGRLAGKIRNSERGTRNEREKTEVSSDFRLPSSELNSHQSPA